jgi:hypothetical protein
MLPIHLLPLIGALSFHVIIKDGHKAGDPIDQAMRTIPRLSATDTLNAPIVAHSYNYWQVYTNCLCDNPTDICAVLLAVWTNTGSTR